jgi:D-alanine-D-alanine ligase
MGKLKIAILYGGRSVEHGVSINSAKNIFEHIDREKFDPLPIGITLDGKWFLTNGIQKGIESGKQISFHADPSHPVLIAGNEAHRPDVFFPVLHGTDGEDGSIQGLLKVMGIPMVGTGVLGSSISMNKLVAKNLLRAAGLPVADYLYARYGGAITPFDEIVRILGLPFMVKSCSLGSSVGITKVKTREHFDEGLVEAFRFDETVLFERFITGREIECGVLGNDPPQASMPGEIIIQKDYEFYTFDAKYVDPDAVKIEVPARLDPVLIDMIRDVAVKTFQTLHAEDFARVDLFLTPDNKIYINEINTIPGFTNSSMYPMMWKERGVSYQELITRLIELSMERAEKAKRISHDFSSSLKY